MDISEFSRRRRFLLRKMKKNSIAILPSQPVQYRNNDVEYPYRPSSDLYYLSGFPEPEALAVIFKSSLEQQFIMFTQARDPKMELWNGRRIGPSGACKHFAADMAFPIDTLEQHLPERIEKCQSIYYTLGAYPKYDQMLIKWLNQMRRKSRSGVQVPLEIIRLDHLIHEMRIRKSPAEITHMRSAAKISARAHCQAMRVCKPGLFEYSIEAEFRRSLLADGCQHLAYSPIIAAGANACTLHYTQNDAQLKAGDLLLIDAAGEYNQYAADITRTFPINGRFNKAQAALYSLVLKANVAAIAAVKPGNRWNDPHDRAVEVITEGLVELKILKGNPQALIKKEAYKPYFMHRTGHWLGMDVHDVGEYKQNEHWRKLEPGMSLTVEPGIYISARSKGVDKQWWNIGIRIEDDVVVTKTGHDILSKDVPKKIEDIQDLMSSHAKAL
jgi:Xaa-Pro aminopeptidase